MKLTRKQQSIVKQVHEFVREECEGFSELDDVFEHHIMGVKTFAEKLADLYKANKFVVLLAAYLHDINYIQTHNHDVHEIEGSIYVKEYLSQFNIDPEDVELVSLCVLHHRGSKRSKRESIEEKIIASADAMDHINRCLQMFYRRISKETYEESIEFMRGKLQRGWKKIELTEGRKLVEKKYEAARVLFEF